MLSSNRMLANCSPNNSLHHTTTPIADKYHNTGLPGGLRSSVDGAPVSPDSHAIAQKSANLFPANHSSPSELYRGPSREGTPLELETRELPSPIEGNTSSMTAKQSSLSFAATRAGDSMKPEEDSQLAVAQIDRNPSLHRDMHSKMSPLSNEVVSIHQWSTADFPTKSASPSPANTSCWTPQPRRIFNRSVHNCPVGLAKPPSFTGYNYSEADFSVTTSLSGEHFSLPVLSRDLNSFSRVNSSVNVNPDNQVSVQEHPIDLHNKEGVDSSVHGFDSFSGVRDRASLVLQEEQASLEVSSETQNAMESSESTPPSSGSVPSQYTGETSHGKSTERGIPDPLYSPLIGMRWPNRDAKLPTRETPIFNATSLSPNSSSFCAEEAKKKEYTFQEASNPDEGEEESDEGMSMARFEQMTNSVQPDRTGVYFCHLCDFTGQSRQEFQSHLYAHYDYKCPTCDYTSRTEGRLKRHMKDFHSKVPPENFSGKSIRTARPKLQRCKQCNFITETKDEFWQHLRAHIKEDKRLECHLCYFVTEYKHHMEYHMRNHEGSKPYKCSKCNYECVNKSMLNSHMKSHSNVYPYRCANCHYATKYCHSLKLHLAKHNHKPAVVLNADGSLPSYDNTDEFLTVRRGSSLKVSTGSQGSHNIDFQNELTTGLSSGDHQLPGNQLFTSNLKKLEDLSFASQFIPTLYPQTAKLPNSASLSSNLMLSNPSLLDPSTFFPSLVNQFKLSSPLFLTGKEAATPNGFHLSAGVTSPLNPIGPRNPVSASNLMVSMLSGCMNGINAETGPQINVDTTNISPTFPSIPPNSPSALAALVAASCLFKSESSSSVHNSGAGSNGSDARKVKLPDGPLTLSDEMLSSDSGLMSNPMLLPTFNQSQLNYSNHVTNQAANYSGALNFVDQTVHNRMEATLKKTDGESALDLSTKWTPTQSSKDTVIGHKPVPDRKPSDRSTMGSTDTVSDKSGSYDPSDVDTNFEPGAFAYECRHCEIRFRQRALYDIHMGFHSHSDPYLCNRCGHQSGDSVNFFIHLGKMAHYS